MLKIDNTDLCVKNANSEIAELAKLASTLDEWWHRMALLEFVVRTVSPARHLCPANLLQYVL
jgi:hypothetical protein